MAQMAVRSYICAVSDQVIKLKRSRGVRTGTFSEPRGPPPRLCRGVRSPGHLSLWMYDPTSAAATLTSP